MDRKRQTLVIFLLGISVGVLLSHFFNLNPSSPFLPLSPSIIQRKAYTLAFDAKTRNAQWVYEKLSKRAIFRPAQRIKAFFKKDPRVFHSATNQDFLGSGFDRGHLCPAEDAKFQQEALDETFYLSNISPQHPQFNRIYWLKLERYVRRLTHLYDTVHVVTGPLFLPHQTEDGKKYVSYQVIGKSEVAVPTHYFKVIRAIKRHKSHTEAYILPNQPIDSHIPLSQFAVTLEKVEHAAGIVFQRQAA